MARSAGPHRADIAPPLTHAFPAPRELLRAGLRGTGLTTTRVETLQAVTKMRGQVELVAAGSLPNDGKVIEDVRKVE